MVIFLHDVVTCRLDHHTWISDMEWPRNGAGGSTRAKTGRRSLSDGHDPPLPRLATAPERVRGAGLQKEEGGLSGGDGSRYRPSRTRRGSCFVTPQTRQILYTLLSQPGR